MHVDVFCRPLLEVAEGFGQISGRKHFEPAHGLRQLADEFRNRGRCPAAPGRLDADRNGGHITRVDRQFDERNAARSRQAGKARCDGYRALFDGPSLIHFASWQRGNFDRNEYTTAARHDLALGHCEVFAARPEQGGKSRLGGSPLILRCGDLRLRFA